MTPITEVRADELRPGDRLALAFDAVVRFIAEANHSGKVEVHFTHAQPRQFNARTFLMVEREAQE